jgi:hypothetical protein
MNIVSKPPYNSYDYFNNSKYINILKKNIFNYIYIKKRINLSHINILYIKGSARLGNFFLCINNAMIFCELFRCKRIIIQNNNIIFIELTFKIRLVLINYHKKEKDLIILFFIRNIILL